MAAAAIPLLTAAAPSIINLIAGLVHKAAPAAEVKYGPATGPVKFADVFAAVMAALNAAATAGQIPKELPPDPVVQLIIQAVVSSMNIQGQLASPTTPAAASATQSITLSPGQSLNIQVAKS